MTTGTLSGHSHVYPVRVYFADTDAFGVVYHSRYLDFAERGRTEMMRLLGHVHAEMRAGGHGAAFVVRHVTIDYRRSAKLDDLLEVHTSVVSVGGATVALDQRIHRPKDSQDVVRLCLQLGCVRFDGRPSRMAADLRSTLQSLVLEEH